MQFPTMVSLQGALPNLSAGGGLLQTSSLGTQSLSLMAPQSPSYASAVPPCSPPGKSTFLFLFLDIHYVLGPVLVMSNLIISGANMGLQVHNNMTPSR
jgi:hypothetical protein